MQVHEFWGFSPIDGSGKNGRWAKESLQLMHDRHSLTLFLNGAYNLRVTRRDAHGAMTGLMKTQIDWIPLSVGAVRPTQGKTLAVMQVSGGSQSFNAVNTRTATG
jgi:hypothetical protein